MSANHVTTADRKGAAEQARDRQLAIVARISARRADLVREEQEESGQRPVAALAAAEGEAGAQERLRRLSMRHTERNAEIEALDAAGAQARAQAEGLEALVKGLGTLADAEAERDQFANSDLHAHAAAFDRAGREASGALVGLRVSGSGFNDDVVLEMLGSVGLLQPLRDLSLITRNAPADTWVDEQGFWRSRHKAAPAFVARILEEPILRRIEAAQRAVNAAERELAAHEARPIASIFNLMETNNGDTNTHA